MSKQVRYGDQVYIEISNLLPPPSTDIRLLSSNSFLEENVFGVKATNYYKANFRNCIFTVLPSLVDSQEDIDILRSLETELDLLSLSKPNTLGQKYLKNEMTYKEEQIEVSKETLKALNEKIMSEMDNQTVRYGDIVILQHLESGYYLCADSTYLPHNPIFYNLRLKKDRTSNCYFKFFSYSVDTDRSPIDYESEMKLKTVQINELNSTVVTMAEIRNSVDALNINHEDDESEDPEKPTFPADAARRDDSLKSFNMDILIVGTTLESSDNNKIKLVEYCSREDILAFNMQKKIKNGDYVRFQLDDFFLTASKSIYRHNFGLFNHKTEGYKYSFLNSIFQIVKVDHEEVYPKGTEIYSHAKVVEDESDISKFYIKHFVTGHYMAIPGENLYVHQSRDEDMAERPAAIPHFHLVNNNPKNQKHPLTRNSRVSLKVFNNENPSGQFYIESQIEKYQILQGDLNSRYFVGFKNSEDRIKSKLKMVKKHVVKNEVVGSFFKVNPVEESEIKEILQFESYCNALKRFMRVLQCMIRENKKVSPTVFYNELVKIRNYSTSLLALLNSSDARAQIIAREFKILDVTARLLFYFFVSPNVESILKARKFEMNDLMKLLKNLCNIVLNSANNNELTHCYMSQYIRVYIHAMFNPSPLFSACSKEEREDLKDHIISLLHTFLGDKDLDSLGQLNFYESHFFRCLDEHPDYSPHLLQLMNHYCKSKCPALINSLRENFIQDYLADANRIVKIFPKLHHLPNEDDFEIELERKGYDRLIKVSTASKEVQRYLIYVFKLINSIAETHSLKFGSVIINYYHVEVCEKLVSSSKIEAEIKNEVLRTLKNVHFGHRELPFNAIPYKIQIVLTSPSFQGYVDQYKEAVKIAEQDIVDPLEAKTIESSSLKTEGSQTISIQKLAIDILQSEFEQLQNGNLKSLKFTLQVMRNVLQDDKSLNIHSLYLIHHSLSEIIEKAASELSEKRKGPYYEPFAKNATTIFKVMKEVDIHIVQMAFKDAINSIKDKILNTSTKVAKLGTLNPMMAQGIASAYSALEKEIVESIIESMTQDWKTKEKLYKKAGKYDPSTNFFEDRVLTSLWKIIEHGNHTLANAVVNLIKNKTSFETQITKELAQCSLLDEEDEISNFTKLSTSLLTLNQIGRRIKAKIEFDFPEKESIDTLDIIIENLERIFLTIYDYQLHLQEEDDNLVEEQAREIFLQRFRYGKTKAKNEIPFAYKPHCVKAFYQKVLRMLQVQDILVPFVKYLHNRKAFVDNIDVGKTKLGYILVMVIMNLFVKNNAPNQNLLSKSPDFITIFYGQDEDFEKITVECNLCFAEMCKDNKSLLKLSDDHLYVITSYIFVEYLNSFKLDAESNNADSSEPINFFRSLPYLFASDIPKDMFNPAEFMTEKFFNFADFLKQDRRISLPLLLAQRNKSEILELNDLVIVENKEQEEAQGQKIMLDMPILYTILKEFLDTGVIFSLTDVKERVLTLHETMTLETVTPFILNENIEFNFELKKLTLQILENLYFKNTYKNTNIFYDYEHYSSFVTVLLIDVYGYLKGHFPEKPKVFDIFNTAYFSSENCRAYLKRYDNLLQSDLDNIVFLQYQSLISFKRLWKDCTYYILCDFFGNLISYVRDFMLLDKEKDNVYQNMFEIWFDLILSLRDSEEDPKYKVLIDNTLKKAIIYSDYAKYREKIYQILGRAGNLGGSTRGKGKAKEPFQLDLEKILSKHLGEKSTFKIEYTEANLNQIAKTLGANKPVLKRLTYVLTLPETSVKDINFILKLFRKLIEGECTSQRKEVDSEAQQGDQEELNLIGHKNTDLPIYNWEDVSAAEFKKISRMQGELNEIKVVEAIFDLLYKHDANEKIVKELLLLSIALLYGGNSDLQDSFYENFKLDYDNQILDNLAQKIEKNLEDFSSKQKQKTRKSYFRALNFIFGFLIDNNQTIQFKNEQVEVPDHMKNALATKYYEEIENEEEASGEKEDDHILLTIILKFLQVLCEGHYLNFQEFLRDQLIVQHYKSFNIPEFLRQAYHTYYRHINISNVEIGSKILGLLIEMEQGDSKPNVQLLLKKTFISDVCNTLNGFNTGLDLLSRGFHFNSSHEKFMEVKSKALVLLKDLVERSEPGELKQISQYINLRSLVSVFKENVIAFHNEIGQYPTMNILKAQHIWHPNLANAFLVYFTLKHLSFDELQEEFIPEIKDELDEVFLNGVGMDRAIAHKYLTKFFKKYTGSIEIMQKKSNRLMKIYYPISVVFDYLKLDTKEMFADTVDRTNTQTKIAELMDASDELISQIYLDYKSRKRFLGLNYNVCYNGARFFTNILGVTVGFLNLFTLVYVDQTDSVEYKEDSHKAAQYGLNITQSILSLVLIALWFKTQLSGYLSFQWTAFTDANVKEQGLLPSHIIAQLDDKDLSEDKALLVLKLMGPYSEEFEYVQEKMKNKVRLYNLYFTLQSKSLLWLIVYFAICVGSIFHPVVAAFQLCDVVVRSDSVGRIATAVTRNARQFLWTLILLLVTVYIYSFIGLYFLHKRYKNDNGDMCSDAYACFLTSLNLGLRSGGGIGDAIVFPEYNSNDKGDYFLHTLFDLSFFILIITLLLNLIFGMIIDAFGELRDEKNENDDDKQNVCFICGLERSEYERISNFDKHTLEEHNMWQYLAYLVYLKEKEKIFATDMTDIESYVSDCYRRKDYGWFPVGRSLTLERQFAKEEREKKSEINELKEDVMGILEKVAAQNNELATELKELKVHVYKTAKKDKVAGLLTGILEKKKSKLGAAAGGSIAM